MLPLLPKGIPTLKVKVELGGEVWLAESRDATNKALNILLARLSAKYTAAMRMLEKNKEKTTGILSLPISTLGINKNNKSDLISFCDSVLGYKANSRST
ncbi:MAG: hypothetical protein ACTS8H_01690 [Arsenophonus sp. NC-PE1-MAG3]